PILSHPLHCTLLISTLPTPPRIPLSSSPSLTPTFFFFYDPPTTDLYTLSLHDALPICRHDPRRNPAPRRHVVGCRAVANVPTRRDRKSTRLNSSHQIISYAVFCLKKKKKKKTEETVRYIKQWNSELWRL